MIGLPPDPQTVDAFLRTKSRSPAVVADQTEPLHRRSHSNLLTRAPHFGSHCAFSPPDGVWRIAPPSAFSSAQPRATRESASAESYPSGRRSRTFHVHRFDDATSPLEGVAEAADYTRNSISISAIGSEPKPKSCAHSLIFDGFRTKPIEMMCQHRRGASSSPSIRFPFRAILSLRTGWNVAFVASFRSGRFGLLRNGRHGGSSSPAGKPGKDGKAILPRRNVSLKTTVRQDRPIGKHDAEDLQPFIAG